MNDQDADAAPGKKKRWKMTVLWIVLGIVAAAVLVPVIRLSRSLTLAALILRRIFPLRPFFPFVAKTAQHV